MFGRATGFRVVPTTFRPSYASWNNNHNSNSNNSNNSNRNRNNYSSQQRRVFSTNIPSQSGRQGGKGLVGVLAFGVIAAPWLVASADQRDDSPYQDKNKQQVQQGQQSGGTMQGALDSFKGTASSAVEWVAPSFSTTTSDVPGEIKGAGTIGKEIISASLQSFGPINSIHNHLCAPHFVNGDLTRQVIAHHFCSHVNEDFHQCAIYDSDAPNARLIGIEYILSEKVFQTLPEEEKQFWHSHAYEVKSGLLTAPGLPETAERALMKHLIRTYGKTVHTWQIDRDQFPLGPPQVMMGFTRDGQARRGVVEELERQTRSEVGAKRMSRADIETPQKERGADSWEEGRVAQLGLIDQRNLSH